jgi:hypothetical protein
MIRVVCTILDQRSYIDIVESGVKLGDNCIVFESFTASIGDLMVANRVYWRRTNGYLRP